MSARILSENNLATKLASCGVVDTTGADFMKIGLAAKLDAALEAWEQETGWVPFVSSGATETRFYDPPGPPPSRGGFGIRGGGRLLSLDGGLLSLTSVVVNGQEYDPANQLRLKPDNAAARRKPVTRIEFSRPVLGPAQCVAVTGVWGYSREWPEDARQAVLDWAAHLCVPELALQISRGLYQWRQGDEQERYGGSGDSGPLAAENALWERNFRETAAGKKRITL